MRMIALLCTIAATTAAVSHAPSGNAMPLPGSADSAWFARTTQALYDAITAGDRAAWDRVLAADFVCTTEDGVVQTRAQFLAEVKGLSPGFSGGITVVNLTVRPLGSGAVVHYWLDEWEDAFGDGLHTRYVVTDSYRRAARRWELVASQVTVVPQDLDPVPVESHDWRALVGEYRLGSRFGPAYHVLLRDGVLYGGSRARSATRLIPLAPLVFFQQGSSHILIFVTDAAGRVDELREIHKFNEVAWQRVGP